MGTSVCQLMYLFKILNDSVVVFRVSVKQEGGNGSGIILLSNVWWFIYTEHCLDLVSLQMPSFELSFIIEL